MDVVKLRDVRMRGVGGTAVPTRGTGLYPFLAFAFFPLQLEYIGILDSDESPRSVYTQF